MRIHSEIVSFPLKTPFAITGHVWTHTDTLRVTVEHGEHRGVGEAVGSYYLNETAGTMQQDLQAALDTLPHDLNPESLQSAMPACGVRNALDCALWDLRAKQQGKRIWQLLDLAPAPVTTVFTIGLESAAVMAERAAAAAPFPHLKIKLDGDDPITRLEAIRAARPDASLVIDVNQGWSFDELREYLPCCERLGIAMIEQPLPRGEDEVLEGFESPVLLGADESCLHLGEFDAAARRYQVLNIKLDKCGGLTEGLALAMAARASGMEVMVGNMTGTSLSMAPSYVIGQLCRFVDIDGPLLLADDLPHGLNYRDGGIVDPPTAALWG